MYMHMPWNNNYIFEVVVILQSSIYQINYCSTNRKMSMDGFQRNPNHHHTTNTKCEWKNKLNKLYMK